MAALVVEGRTNREIAQHLFISPHTVNAHLRHVFDKMGVRSRVELTRMAADGDRQVAGGSPHATARHRPGRCTWRGRDAHAGSSGSGTRTVSTDRRLGRAGHHERRLDSER